MPGRAQCGSRSIEWVDGGGALLSHGRNEIRFLFAHRPRHSQFFHGLSDRELPEKEGMPDEGLSDVEM
jgi:hypothetical protein